MFSQDRPSRTRVVAFWRGARFPFRYCPSGTFWFGSPETEPGRTEREARRFVEIESGFWILETPTTQKMWRAVVGDNPSQWRGDFLPVENVSWFDCRAFLARLETSNEVPKGWRLELPTEVQWEYAARAGTTTPYYCGAKLRSRDANFDDRDADGAYLGRTTPVDAYPPNPWGLRDVHGDVWEWTLDALEGSENRKVLRGGSWHSVPERCRCAFRHSDPPEHRHDYLGFRFVMVRTNAR